MLDLLKFALGSGIYERGMERMCLRQNGFQSTVYKSNFLVNSTHRYGVVFILSSSIKMFAMQSRYLTPTSKKIDQQNVKVLLLKPIRALFTNERLQSAAKLKPTRYHNWQ